MTPRLTVAWVNWSDRGEAPPPLPDLTWLPLRDEELLDIRRENAGAEGVVINVHPSDPLGVPLLQQAVDSCPVPIVLRIPQDRIAEALPHIRGSDDLCPREASPAWLSHRIRRLLLSNDRDPLTQLLHPQAFRRRLLAALTETTPVKPVSLLMVGLDRFSRINSQHSFEAGNGILVSTAALLRSVSGILASRLKGDEFAVLAPGMDERKAALYAGDLCKRIAIHQSSGGLAVTASIGVATAEKIASEVDALLQSAETAMYSAKAQGRNRAVHFRDLERESLRTGADIRFCAFEVVQRVRNERVEEDRTLRGRILFQDILRGADYDALTGLYNRGYLDRRFTSSCEEAWGAARPMCVALIDVDHFGQVNRDHGHPTGDQALRDVANVIQQNVRGGDWVARYGGEEIAVILGATPDEAVRVVERIREAVARHPFRTTEGNLFTVTISAGVVAVEVGEKPTQLWDRASKKVLEAKSAGRNQVRA